MSGTVTGLHRRVCAWLGGGCLVFLLAGHVPVSSSDFSLPVAINHATTEHAPSPLFFPCIIVDTTAGNQIKVDSEMTVYSSAIHPDVIYIPGGWNGHKYWASFSPYPHLVTGMGNENPHVVCSDDGVHWTDQVGKKRKQSIKNPLDRRSRANRFDHLSDPDLLMNKDSVLWIIYRARFGTNPDTISFVARGSRDGINWSPPAVFLSGVTRRDLRYENSGLSPSIMRIEGQFHLWYIDGQTRPHRIFHLTSYDLFGEWQVSDSTDLANNPRVRADIWHMNVIQSPDGFLLGLFTYTDSATHGQNCRLRLAASTDFGTTWTIAPHWLMEHAADGTMWDGNQIYRSGGYFDNENSRPVLKLYYSAMRIGKVPIWSTGLTNVYFDGETEMDSTSSIR